MREARKAGVKVATRLDSNLGVALFGLEFRKKDVLNNIKPIKRTIYCKSCIVYSLKRCVGQGTAGNLPLVRGEGFGDFISLFTTGLNTKS